MSLSHPQLLEKMALALPGLTLGLALSFVGASFGLGLGGFEGGKQCQRLKTRQAGVNSLIQKFGKLQQEVLPRQQKHKTHTDNTRMSSRLACTVLRAAAMHVRTRAQASTEQVSELTKHKKHEARHSFSAHHGVSRWRPRGAASDTADDQHLSSSKVFKQKRILSFPNFFENLLN